MLKFFRKYNKIILVVGACFLMFAFLIQPVISIFMPNPMDQPVGKIGQKELTRRDQQGATAELRVLSRIQVVRLMVRSMVGANNSQAALHWLLLLDDAQRLGLDASNQEVAQAVQMLGLTDQRMDRLGNSVKAGSDFVRQALRHWLIVEQYRSLVTTQTFGTSTDSQGAVSVGSPGLSRLRKAGTILQQLSKQKANARQRRRLMALANTYLSWVVHGSQRLSQPVVRAFLQDNRGQVKGKLVSINAADRIDQVDPPTDKQLQKLFEKYRDVSAGQSGPFGFGYRIPDRVKLEYLQIPLAGAQEQVSVRETEALKFYRQHKDQFVKESAKGGSQNPSNGQAGADKNPSAGVNGSGSNVVAYKQVRDQIFKSLKRKKAQDLVENVLHAAEGRLKDAERSLPDNGQYVKVPEDYQPLSLKKLAQQLRQQYQLNLTSHEHTADWISVNELSSLGEIGRAVVGGSRQRHSLAQYIESARELKPAEDNPLAVYRLQTKLASQPLRASNGDRFIFRLTAAQPAHNPESLDVVRQQVVHDAKLRTAYRQLLSRQSQLLTKAQKQGMTKLAKSVNAQARSFGPVSRRQSSARGGVNVPYVQGIGRSQTFIDALFKQANQLTGSGKIADQPMDKRLIGVGLKRKLSLVLARIDSYQPLTKSEFEQEASQSLTGAQISRQLIAQAGPGQPPQPLSLVALKRRTNFVAASSKPGKSTNANQARQGNEIAPGKTALQ